MGYGIKINLENVNTWEYNKETRTFHKNLNDFLHYVYIGKNTQFNLLNSKTKNWRIFKFKGQKKDGYINYFHYEFEGENELTIKLVITENLIEEAGKLLCNVVPIT